MRSLAGLVLAAALIRPAAAADPSFAGAYLDVTEVLLEEEVVIRPLTRMVSKQHCSSCAGYGLPWSGLGRNRHTDLPWGGLKSSCPPVGAIRVSRPVLVRAKG
jgi:hypothetical protein